MPPRAPRASALAFLATLAFLAAGCVSPALTPAASTDAPPLADGPRPEVAIPRFSVPVLLDTITGGAEPNLAIHGDDAWITSPLHLWKSTDAGKTWAAVGKDACGLRAAPVCPPGFATKDPGLVGGGDGATAVDANGTLYWAGLGGGVPVQVSTDGASTWSKEYDVANKSSSDREWLAVDRNGVVHVSWRDFGAAGSNAEATVTTRASSDQGKTWGPAVRVVKDGHQGPIAPDPSSDRLYLPHVLDGTKLMMARSDDGGATWTDLPVGPLVDDTFQFPIASVDTAGTVYVTYANGNFDKTNNYQLDRFPNVPTIMLTHSSDHGATWSKPVAISAAGRPAVFPWIAAGAPGRVVVAFYEATFPLPLVAPNEWHVTVVESTTADKDAPTLARAYVTDKPNHVGQVCVVGSGCGPQDRSLLDFFEIRLFADGTPALTYTGDADLKQQTVKVYFAKMSEGTKLRG